MTEKFFVVQGPLWLLLLFSLVPLGLQQPCLAQAQAEQVSNDTAGSTCAAGSLPPGLRLTLRQDWRQDAGPMESSSTETSGYRRYAMLCMANAYPGLESEKLITDYFDPLMQFIAPGFDGVNTFSNMRDDHLLWVPNVGGGYNVSRYFSLFLTLGYGAGPVHTKEDNPTIFLWPVYLDFEMKRSAFTITPGIDYFPFGMVEQRDYHGLMDRLRAIRPMIGLRVPWTYAGYKARVRMGPDPLKYLLDIKLGDSWCVWSANLNAGFDVPINRRNQLNINVGHSFFFGQDSDFGGPVFAVTWKYFF